MKKYALNLYLESENKNVNLFLFKNGEFLPLENVFTYIVLDIESEIKKLRYSIQEVDSKMHLIEVYQELVNGKNMIVVSSNKELDIEMKELIFRKFETGEGTEMVFQDLFLANSISELKDDESFPTFINDFIDEIEEYFNRSAFTKFKDYFKTFF